MNAVTHRIRVYYKTREPFCINSNHLFAGPFNPADFGAVVVVDDGTHNLKTREDVFAGMNRDDRPGGQSFRALSAGDVVEIDGLLHQCLPLGWRELSPTEVSMLRARFGIDDLSVQHWDRADSIRRAADMLEMAIEALCETGDHPQPDVGGARHWVNGALAVWQPYRAVTAEFPAQPLRYTLYSAEDAGRTQDVLIFLSEHVEVVMPKPGVLPGVMDPTHELAVVRVEVLDGDVRAMIWDRRTLECAGEALVINLVPARAPTTSLPEG